MAEIFLSHSSKDKNHAENLKQQIEINVPGVKVFVSSLPEGIPAGAWERRVFSELNDAEALVLLLTPTSVKRLWVAFELGYFWGKADSDKRIHAVLKSISPNEIPSPLKIIQGKSMDDVRELEVTFSALREQFSNTSPASRISVPAGAPETVVQAVHTLNTSADPSALLGAIETLGNIKHHTAEDVLIQATKNINRRVRKQAVRQLTSPEYTRATLRLIEILQDKEESDELRQDAAHGLRERKESQAIEPLLSTIEQDSVSPVAIRIADALATLLFHVRDELQDSAITATVIDRLIRLLSEDLQLGAHQQIIRALGFLKAEKAVPNLKPFLQHEDRAIRRQTEFALREISVQEDLSEVETTQRKSINFSLANEFTIPETYRGKTISVVRFMSNGKYLIVGMNRDTVGVWDVASGSLKDFATPKNSAAKAQGINWHLRSVTVSPDSSLIASTTHDPKIQIWRLKGLKPERLIETMNHRAMAIDFLYYGKQHDGKWLIAGLESGRMCSFALHDNFRRVQTLVGHEDGITALKAHPTKLSFVTASIDGQIKYWELADEEMIFVHSYEGHDAEHIVDVAISPDGNLLASGSVIGEISLWHLETGEFIRTLNDHQQHIRSLEFSPDGQLLVSGSNDNTLKVWSVDNGARLISKRFEHPVKSMSFSPPDGKFLATANEASKIIQLWELH